MRNICVRMEEPLLSREPFVYKSLNTFVTSSLCALVDFETVPTPYHHSNYFILIPTLNVVVISKR